LHVLRVLLEEFAWGRCECWPGDQTLANLTGLSLRTVSRCLHDLVELGVIRILNPQSWRRRIEFPTHPGLSEDSATVAECSATVTDSLGHPGGQNPLSKQDESHKHVGRVKPVVVGPVLTGGDAPALPFKAPGSPAERPAAPVPTGIASGPSGVPPGAIHGDLALLIGRAMERWSDATPAKVETLVMEFGFEHAKVTVFGLPRLESLRGAEGACRNWRRGPGPTDAERRRAREGIAAARPVIPHRAPHWTETDREEAQASGADLTARLAAARLDSPRPG
jgi:hypothetical protein